MRSKFVLTVAAGLLAGTVMAAAQGSGAPSNNNDRTGQPTDSSSTSTQPNRGNATQGRGGGMMDNRGAVQSAPPSAGSGPLPGEPQNGAAPRQGEGSGDDAIPRRK
jgi:hypothetical protein